MQLCLSWKRRGTVYGNRGRPLSAYDKKSTVSLKSVTCYDPYQNVVVSLEWDIPQEIWTFPVEVVSLSEQGFERNYQSTMIMPIWPVDLTQGPKEIHIKLSLKQTREI